MEELHFILTDEICRIETSVGAEDNWALESGRECEVRIWNQIK